MKILVVDDMENVRKLIRLTLESDGHEVLEAQDGIQAIVVANRCTPDLLITDIVMPNKEGLETIMEFRRIHPDVPIIAISGGGKFNTIDYLPLARKMGASLTLRKPFGPSQIIDAVATATAN